MQLTVGNGLPERHSPGKKMVEAVSQWHSRKMVLLQVFPGKGITCFFEGVYKYGLAADNEGCPHYTSIDDVTEMRRQQ